MVSIFERKLSTKNFKVRDNRIDLRRKTNDLIALLVTDAMQRESAIADDYWRYTFQHEKKDRTEVSLQNIDRK